MTAIAPLSDLSGFFAEMVAGSPVILRQQIDTPADSTTLSLNYKFETLTGQLDVLLDGVSLGSLIPSSERRRTENSRLPRQKSHLPIHIVGLREKEYAVKVGDFQWVRIPPGQSVAQPEATRAAEEVTNSLKYSGVTGHF